MHTLNIILCSVNLAFCILNAIAQEDKRNAYFVGSMGWLVALINVAF